MKRSAWMQLIARGWIARLPSRDEDIAVGRVLSDEPSVWLLMTGAKVPGLLTERGRYLFRQWLTEENPKAAPFSDDRDRALMRCRHAPLILVDELWPPNPKTTGSATDRQKKFLRDMGVRNQNKLLNRITRQEASELIGEVLKLRENIKPRTA